MAERGCGSPSCGKEKYVLLSVGIALCAVGAVALLMKGCSKGEEMDEATYKRITLDHIGAFIHELRNYEIKMGTLPRGDEMAVVPQMIREKTLDPGTLGRLTNQGKIKKVGGTYCFVDALGKPILYRFPPRETAANKQNRIELYAFGLNGIDNNGLDDDLPISESLELNLKK